MNLLCCGGSEKRWALKKVEQERRGDLDPVTSWSCLGEVLPGAARYWLEQALDVLAGAVS